MALSKQANTYIDSQASDRAHLEKYHQINQNARVRRDARREKIETDQSHRTEDRTVRLKEVMDDITCSSSLRAHREEKLEELKKLLQERADLEDGISKTAEKIEKAIYKVVEEMSGSLEARAQALTE